MSLARISVLKLGTRQHVMLAGIKKLRITDPDIFIRSIRAIRRSAAVQVLDADFVAGRDHILEVLKQSLQARKSGSMLSRRIEIDLLLRVACTNQISTALDDVGIKEGVNNVLVIAIGTIKDLRALGKHLEKNFKPISSSGGEEVFKLSGKKERLLLSHHGISRKEINACMDGNKLACLLAERSNLLW